MTQDPHAAPDAELRRLRWRCRRGMRELDRLCERWLEHGHPTASEAERRVFLRLLDCEDDRLWRWFMGYEACPDAELDALIARIRSLPA
ncbi:MAG TPA: succinate dehydrogenase assembly factor 2 [Pseudoxanthomonas sp.]|nr:succinate dehydrogenase assembly factor 2 [Pseudoxanthomonas sp.]